MYQNLFDSHTHSENSLDGHHSITFMVEAAAERNIQGFAITDHCDCESLEETQAAVRLRQSAFDAAIARTAFRNQIIITSGVELGQPHLNYEGAEAFLAEHRFDFILLSLHRIRDWDEFFDMDYSDFTEEKIRRMMEQYFSELLEIVKWGRFDSLAHLNLPMRYMKIRHNIEVDLTAYFDQIDAVLKELVSGGKALEINTSGLRRSLRDTMPPSWVVERYRELGGELVTIGSDAHTAPDIGMHIRDGMHLLLELGFEFFAFYRERKPILLRII